jgi:hypothetical protein
VGRVVLSDFLITMPQLKQQVIYHFLEKGHGNLRDLVEISEFGDEKGRDESSQQDDRALEKKGLSDAGWGLGTTAVHRNPGEGGGGGNGKNGKNGRKFKRAEKVPVFPGEPGGGLKGGGNIETGAAILFLCGQVGELFSLTGLSLRFPSRGAGIAGDRLESGRSLVTMAPDNPLHPDLAGEEKKEEAADGNDMPGEF